jgi:hypothetical protein
MAEIRQDPTFRPALARVFELRFQKGGVFRHVKTPLVWFSSSRIVIRLARGNWGNQRANGSSKCKSPFRPA